MRLFYILLVLFFATSCATNKIKLVKNKDYKREVVVVNTSPQKKSSKRTKVTNRAIENKTVLATIDETVTPHPSIDITEDSLAPPKKKDGGEILYQARTAEKKAKKARNQAIIGASFNILSFILPFAIIVTLIMLILSLVNYSKANSSRYITTDGERYLNAAKITLIISTVILAIFIGAIIAVFLL